MKNNQLIPNVLHKGSTVAIVATAKAINDQDLQYSINLLQTRGYNVLLSPYLHKQHHQLAGTDAERAAGLQWAINHKDVEAIFCFRGGYGTYKITDKVDFSELSTNPKWIIGYSDITGLQLYLYKHYHLVSLHGTMPVNFKNNTPEALNSMFTALEEYSLRYTIAPHALNIDGRAEGILLGGNLSLIYSMTGTNDLPDFENSILFIEDLDEYLYHVDRMMLNLDKSGILNKISGLVVGGLTNMKDNDIPFGKEAEEIIFEYFSKYNKPLCFNFPTGHINDNRALIIGKNANFIVNKTFTEFFQ